MACAAPQIEPAIHGCRERAHPVSDKVHPQSKHTQGYNCGGVLRRERPGPGVRPPVKARSFPRGQTGCAKAVPDRASLEDLSQNVPLRLGLVHIGFFGEDASGRSITKGSHSEQSKAGLCRLRAPANKEGYYRNAKRKPKACANCEGRPQITFPCFRTLQKERTCLPCPQAPWIEERSRSQI